MEITQKIAESQNEDIKVAVETLSNTLNHIEIVKQCLELAETLAKQQNEEIAYLQKRGRALKRTRITCISICGGGLLVGTLGYILKQDENTKDIGNVLFYSGLGLTASSGVTLVFTIPF